MKFITLLNTLSLDTALIGIIWQHLIAQAIGFNLTISQRLILATSVWLAYVGDHWLDGLRYKSIPKRSPERRFFYKNKTSILLSWSAILIMIVIFAFLNLSQFDLSKGLILLSVSIGYTYLAQSSKLSFSKYFPKEFLVALILTLGIILFPLTKQTILIPFLWISSLLLVLLFFSNCLLIALNEKDLDLHLNEKSFATESRHPKLIILCLNLSIITISVITFYLLPHQNSPILLIFITCSASFIFTNNKLKKHNYKNLRIWADTLLLLIIPSTILIIWTFLLGPLK